MNDSRSPSPPGGPQPCDLLVRNGLVLTMDAERRVFSHGAVAITAREIVAVGPDRELGSAFLPARVLDAGGAVVHPGMIDAHYHATLHLTRGAISDAPHVPAEGEEGPSFGVYSRWFNVLDEQDEYASTQLACIEMLRNGFTCFMDPGTVLEPDAAAAAIEAVGVRGSLADPFLWDVPDALDMASEIDRAPATTKRALAELGRQLARNADVNALVRGHVAVYGTGTVSDELAVAAKACADENGAQLTFHQNFDPSDVAFDDARFGRHAVMHLVELGLVDERTTLAHMNVLRDDEVDVLAGTGASVVWHPGNFLFYGIASAVPGRMPELHARGVPLTFGTDAAKAYTFGDMPWLAYLVARMNGGYLSAETLLELQTIGAARAVGLEGLTGSIEPGKRADIVVRTEALPEAHPGVSPVRELVLVSRGRSVAHVIVDGRVVLERGEPTLVDAAQAYALARASVRHTMERVGIEAELPWPLLA